MLALERQGSVAAIGASTDLLRQVGRACPDSKLGRYSESFPTKLDSLNELVQNAETLLIAVTIDGTPSSAWGQNRPRLCELLETARQLGKELVFVVSPATDEAWRWVHQYETARSGLLCPLHSLSGNQPKLLAPDATTQATGSEDLLQVTDLNDPDPCSAWLNHCGKRVKATLHSNLPYVLALVLLLFLGSFYVLGRNSNGAHPVASLKSTVARLKHTIVELKHNQSVLEARLALDKQESDTASQQEHQEEKQLVKYAKVIQRLRWENENLMQAVKALEEQRAEWEGDSLSFSCRGASAPLSILALAAFVRSA